MTGGTYLYQVIVVAAMLAVIVARPEGAPAKACNDLVPKHGGASKQTSPAPYKVAASVDTAAAGDEIKVTIEVSGNETAFKGFLMRGEMKGKPVGQFKKGPKYQLRNCSGNDTAITHENRQDKTKITATWIVPESTGNVIFYATVVKSEKTFWVKIPSDPVKIEKV